MKKKSKIIILSLFAISSVFIGTGALLIDNSFYIKNNSDVIISVKCEPVDGEFTDYSISVGDSVKVYSKKIFKLNNNPLDFKSLIKTITIIALNDTIQSLNPKWVTYTDGRKNSFVYVYSSENL